MEIINIKGVRREVLATSVIPHDSLDFQSFSVALMTIRDNGYSVGSMQSNAPIGICKNGNTNFKPYVSEVDKETRRHIYKWRHIEDFECKYLDGILRSDDFRYGPVEIILFKPYV